MGAGIHGGFGHTLRSMQKEKRDKKHEKTNDIKAELINEWE
jgi:hypothetical protein